MTTQWQDFDWQLIHQPPQSPSLHVALDELLTQQVAAGERPPTLRFWEWQAPCIVIGRFQSLRNEVDVARAAELGINIVRRSTGGGAMFMEAGNCITYSIYAPDSLVAGMDFQQSYAFFDQWVIDGLASLGINAWYQPLNDITSEGGKIGGAAQRRHRGSVLHHVTMAYDIDADKMLQVLRIGREKMSDKGTTSAAKRVDPLRSQTGLSRGAIIEQLIGTFREQHGLTPGELSAADIEAATQLMQQRYATTAWTAKIP